MVGSAFEVEAGIFDERDGVAEERAVVGFADAGLKAARSEQTDHVGPVVACGGAAIVESSGQTEYCDGPGVSVLGSHERIVGLLRVVDVFDVWVVA